MRLPWRRAPEISFSQAWKTFIETPLVVDGKPLIVAAKVPPVKTLKARPSSLFERFRKRAM